MASRGGEIVAMSQPVREDRVTKVAEEEEVLREPMELTKEIHL